MTRFSGPLLIDPLGAHVPLSPLSAATQFHLVADFDAQNEHHPHDRTYDFTRWAVVVLFPAGFQNFAGKVLMACCSLCEHTAQRHHLYAHSNPDHEEGIADADDDLPAEDDAWLVSLPPDFSLANLMAPCHHARAVITYILCLADLDISWRGYDQLLKALLGVCASHRDPPTFPLRLSHRKVTSLEVYSSSDRLYYVFANVEKRGSIITYCSHCARRLRKGRACRHQRDFDRLEAEEAEPFVYHALDYERDDEDEEEDDTGILSTERYPCTHMFLALISAIWVDAFTNTYTPDDIYSDPPVREAITDRQSSFAPTMNRHYPGRACVPEARTCPSCNSSDLDSQASRHLATVFGSQFLRDWHVFQGRCRACAAKIAFDGRRHGIINYKNRCLFPVELLNEFLKIYSRTGVAATAWWDSKVEEQVRPLFNDEDADEDEIAEIEREWTRLGGQMCRIVAGFASLIDVPSDLFACCESPRAIAADGIVLSVRSTELNGLKTPWIWEQAPTSAKKRASKPGQRSLPCNAAELVALKALQSGSMDVTMLQAACDNEQSYPSTGPRSVLTLSLAHRKSGNSVSCPLSVRDFVLCFTRTISPAIQLLPSALWSFVDSSLLSNDFPSITTTLLENLTKYSPILSRLFTCARGAPRLFRSAAIRSVIAVIKELRAIAGRISSIPLDGSFNTTNCTAVTFS